MMRSILSSIFLLAVSPVWASTFVGNGGNAGDVELQVTLSQITNTLNYIVSAPEDENEKLCQCERVLEQHKVCESLKNSNQRQNNYCADQTASKAKDILKLLESENGVQVVWTSRSMEVSENTGDREADAIANPKAKKITLNREQFLKLKDYERVFLLSHELGHLIQIDKKYLSDDEPVGPFKQVDGGRQFLNSMASAITMKSLTTGQVADYVQVLHTSKSYQSNWISFSLGTEHKREDQSRLAIEKYSGWDISYRHQLNQAWGITGGARLLKGENEFFSMTQATTELKLYNVQLNYRFFPVDNPLSPRGQSHFVFGLGIEAGQAKYKLQDDFTEEDDKADLLSPLVNGQYFLALNSGLWLNAGLTYTNHKYTFNNIGFGGYKSDPNQIYMNIGASYGF